MKLAIYGAGGNGRELAATVRRAFETAGEVEIVFVTDDGGPAVNGFPHITFSELDPSFRVSVSVAEPAIRKRLVERCQQAGFRFFDVRALSLVDLGARVGEGCVFFDHTLISANAVIGRHFHGNYFSQVSHDCRIGDFVTFGPGVRCNGNVTIGDGAYVGAGAMIRQGLTIGSEAFVAMGAVVVKNVAPGVTVMGCPARTPEEIAARSRGECL